MKKTYILTILTMLCLTALKAEINFTQHDLTSPVTIFYGLNESHSKSWAQTTNNGLIGISYFRRSAGDRYTGDLIYKSIQPDGTEKDEIVSTGNSLEVSVLVFDSQSKPHIFVASSDEVDQTIVHFFKTSEITWSSENIVHFNNEGGKYIYEMSAERGPDNLFHLLVLKTRSNPDSEDYYYAYKNAHLYHLNNDQNGNWQKELIYNYDTVWTLDEYSKALNRQDMKVDKNGKIHVVFNKQINSSSRLEYATNKNGCWEIETAVNFSAGTRDDGGWFPSLALDNEDQPYISCVYVGRCSSGSATYAKLLFVSRDENSWTQEIIAANDDGYYGSDGRNYTGALSHLVFDQNNQPHIVFSDIASSHAGMNYWNLGNIRYAVKENENWMIYTIYEQPLPNGFFNAVEMYGMCLLISDNVDKIRVIGQQLIVNSSTDYSFTLVQKDIENSSITEELIKQDELFHNYPNPFNPVTVIKYNLESANNVILNIYNAKGDLVQNLVSRNQPAGRYSVSFDASGINSGVYFYKLALDGKSVVRKMLLLK